MANPTSRQECEELLLSLKLNRDLKRRSPKAFREKVDLAWQMAQEGDLMPKPMEAQPPSPKNERARTHGRPINARVTLMGTHLPERQAALRRQPVRVGEEVAFAREPSNPHDHNAVRVLTKKRSLFGLGPARFLGYIPREMAERMAPRMDRGVRFEGALEHVWYPDHYDDVNIELRVRQLDD